MPDFEKLFLLEGENSPEIVFAVQAVGGTGGWANENDGVALWLPPRTADISSWGFSTPIGPSTPDN